jgi:hypothetical protein
VPVLLCGCDPCRRIKRDAIADQWPARVLEMRARSHTLDPETALHQLLQPGAGADQGSQCPGMAPTKLPSLAARRVFYMSNGRVHLVRSEHTTHSGELVIATLRDALHTVAFAWPGAASRLGSVSPASDCAAE